MVNKTSELIKLEWAVLCENSLIDGDSQNLTLVNLIERLKFEGERVDKTKDFNSSEGELLPMRMTLVTRIRRLVEANQKLEFDITYDFIDPEKKKLGNVETTFNMDPGILNFRMRFGVEGLKLTKSGMYWFIIKAKQKDEKSYTKLGEVPLEIELSIK